MRTENSLLLASIGRQNVARQGQGNCLMCKRALILFLLALLASTLWPTVAGAEGNLTISIVGYLVDSQGQPVRGASLLLTLDDRPLSLPRELSVSPKDGTFAASFDISTDEFEQLVGNERLLLVRVESPYYQDAVWQAKMSTLAINHGRMVIDVGELVLSRAFGPGSWLALAVFLATLLAIVFERLHRTTVALLGATGILLSTHTLGHFLPSWHTLTFEQAVGYIDLEVIFLLLGMMIIISVLEETGVFQWFAFAAYRSSGGRPWLLAIMLMLVTAVLSGMLDNVTTVLLISPLTIEIALQMRLDPLSLLIPEILASNIGGAATLIGDPPNILIGSYAGLTFNDFLREVAPGVGLTLLVVIPFVVILYRKQYAHASKQRSPALEQRLRDDARITQPQQLKRTLAVLVITFAGFVLGSGVHLPPAVPALFGAALLLAWVQPDLVKTFGRVDWTTILFFIGLFVQVGALQEVGFLSEIAAASASIVGSNLTVAMLFVFALTLVGSALVDNIPFTAAMLPVVSYLSTTMGPDGEILYWALAFGACYGGNGTLIGASANLVVAGYAERVGFPLSYGRYLRVGLPVTVLSGLVAALWLLARL